MCTFEGGCEQQVYYLETLARERRYQPHDRQTNIRQRGNNRQNQIVKALLNQDAGIAIHVIDHPLINELRQSLQARQNFQTEQSENEEYQQTRPQRCEQHGDWQCNVNASKHGRLPAGSHWHCKISCVADPAMSNH